MLTNSQILLVAVFTQALLYGIYLETLIQCFRWLIFTDEGWKSRQRISHSVTTFATIFIFLMFTINLATSLTFELKTHLRRDKSWNKAAGVMVLNVTEILPLLSIDSVLIYRCWVVYSKSWRVICVPTIFWLAWMACSTLFWYASGLDHNGQTYSPELAQLGDKAIIGLYACNIAITLYATTAIIYRILSTRNTSGGSPKRLNYVMRILAESGILYTSMVILSLVSSTITTGNNATQVEWLVASIFDPIGYSMAGISFNLIIIRVYQSRVERLAESRDVYGERALPVTQFSNPQITASSEGPSSDVLDEAVDEMQEQHGSRDA